MEKCGECNGQLVKVIFIKSRMHFEACQTCKARYENVTQNKRDRYYRNAEDFMNKEASIQSEMDHRGSDREKKEREIK